MPAATPTILIWLTRYTGFPARRLPARAELLVLFAAAADERALPTHGGPITRKDIAQHASQKQLSKNRRHAHFKSDNRTAV